MRVLSRHFLASYLKFFVSALFAASAVVVIVELLLDFDEILGDRADVSDLASYLFVRLPSYYFRDLIPLCSFAAAFLSVGLAARSREVLAATAGGIAPQRMVVPILGGAMLLTAAAALLDETVVLSATREWNRRAHGGLAAAYRQGSFWYRRGDTLFNVQDADPDSATLRGVRVFQTDPDGRLRTSWHAALAQVDADRRWHLRDATIRSFDPDTPAAPPRVEHRNDTLPAVALERDLALVEAGAQTLSLPELLEYVRARSAAGRASARQREMLHARLANPWLVVAFALLAIPLGLSVGNERGLAAAALTGIAVLAVFFAARSAASILAAGGLAAAAYAPWLLVTALLCAGGARFARASS